jgi:hypothetical protein
MDDSKQIGANIIELIPVAWNRDVGVADIACSASPPVLGYQANSLAADVKV